MLLSWWCCNSTTRGLIFLVVLQLVTLRVLQKHSHVVLFQKIALHVVISFGVDGSRKKKTCGAEKVPQTIILQKQSGEAGHKLISE